MKKVSITVDLDDNELFEEEVMKAIRGYARQEARSAVAKEITSEIQRIVDRAIKDSLSSTWGYQYSGSLYKKVYDTASELIKEVNEDKVKKIVNDAFTGKVLANVNDSINEAVKKATDTAKADMTDYVNKLIATGLLSSIKDAATNGDNDK